ncbi:cytochrome P450 [Phlegmacium glaucopus]|nr:cytochrome P450 [Phlegmacium glaucopus]
MSTFVTLVAIAILSIIYLFFRFVRSDGDIDKLLGPHRQSFFHGNLKQVYGRHTLSWHSESAKKHGKAFRIYGYLWDKQVYITDSKALDHIIVKDRDSYEQTPWLFATNEVIFGPGLFSSVGDRHKRQRKIINPMFSLAHIRDLTPIFQDIAEELRDIIAAQVRSGTKEIEMTPWLSKTALELIGRGGLGYSFNAFNDSAEDQYAHAIKKLLPSISFVRPLRRIMPFLVKIGSDRFRQWVVHKIPLKNVRNLCDVVDKMAETTMEIYRHQMKHIAANDLDSGGKDIMNLILKAKATDPESGQHLSEEEVLALMTTFVFAANDTTSNSLCRLLWIMITRPKVQQELREEIVKSRRDNGGTLDHDTLASLPSLDSIVLETMRLHPPIPRLSRITQEDVILPLSEPVTLNDGTKTSSLHLRKNTQLVIGIIAANRDPDIWGPDAHEWKPERWLGERRLSMEKKFPGVYSGQMTFLGGERSCVGFKFSELEMKVVLSTLVEAFVFEPAADCEYIWCDAGVVMPSVKGRDKPIAEFPIKVSLVNP